MKQQKKNCGICSPATALTLVFSNLKAGACSMPYFSICILFECVKFHHCPFDSGIRGPIPVGKRSWQPTHLPVSEKVSGWNSKVYGPFTQTWVSTWQGPVLVDMPASQFTVSPRPQGCAARSAFHWLHRFPTAPNVCNFGSCSWTCYWIYGKHVQQALSLYLQSGIYTQRCPPLVKFHLGIFFLKGQMVKHVCSLHVGRALQRIHAWSCPHRKIS